ncbi:hypothetical protein EJ04DRAFT_601935 [Polyplosphaeria fusca]|uniref:Rhodopsin domain-containing protein n=1 Tax=Polyplosphaeria fusca TaxID=682080 RepID=A0A9P4R0U8_9PLEO|nr:hypothetical protein EJ04DRAFT_601935 [Polyplosphaeria fusca]
MIENRGPELLGVCAATASMAFVATMLRLYVRIRLVKAFGWDDAWMTGALLGHIMFATCAICGIHYGTGRHMADLSPEAIFLAMRYWWLCYIAYCLTMICAKISIGLFLLRVTVSPIHRWIIYINMFLTALTGTVFFFVTLLQCHPISFFWNRSIEGGSCVDVEVIIALTFLYSAISAICDFTFGILPIFLVWGLNMSRRMKLMLIPLLSMACIASTAVVVRMAFVTRFRSKDFLWDTVDIAIWSDIEQGLAVTAGSLATLRPLYREVAQRLGWSHAGTNEKPSARTPGYARRPDQSNGQKRSGPFSLVTFTKKSRNSSDDEYNLGDTKPIQLRDDLLAEGQLGKADAGFRSWRVQVGEGSSEEDLNQKTDFGGITRQKDVYLTSETARKH